VLEQPGAEGSWRPLFSMVTANPHDSFQMGQIADVTGDGNTFTLEDLRVDQGGDKDYNDFVFQVRGATGEAVLMDEVVAPNKDWRNTDAGQLLVSYAEQYVEAPIEGGVSPSPDGFAGNNGLLPAPPLDLPLDFEPSAGEALPNPADGVSPDAVSNLPGPLPTYTETRFEFPAENQPVIGIIDTGFAGNNPDLKFSNITWGKDYVSGDLDPTLAAGEGSQHGTHILGVIAAQQDNGVGIDGISPDAPIYATRAIGSGAWAEALTDTVDHIKASGQPNGVVNLSLDLTQRNPDGSITTRYELTPQERGAIEYARQNGVVLVVAAGNDGGVMSVLGQASQEFDNIVTVGAVDRTNGDVSLYLGTDRVDYASYGDGLTVVADGGTPENPVLSTVDDGVGTMAGTSVATARVTGTVSQIWAANPELSYRQVIDILKQTATDLGATGWDAQTGAGLVNLAAAISLARMTVGEGKIDPDDFWTPTTWSGAGKVSAQERPVEIYDEYFTARLKLDPHTPLFTSPSLMAESGYVMEVGTNVEFDGWTYGDRVYDWLLPGDDALWFRLRLNDGGTYWIPSAYTVGYPPSRPPVLPVIQEEASTDSEQNSNDVVDYLPETDPDGSAYGTDDGQYVDEDYDGYDDEYTPPVDPFASVYSAYQAILGGAVGGRFSPQAGVEAQNYANGQILRTPNGTYALFGAILKLYNELGGVNSWLGLPMGNTVNQGNGFLKQDFENGYIVWNGNRATAYRVGPGVPITNLPPTAPTAAPKIIDTQPMGGIRGRLVQGMNFRNYPWINNSTLAGSMPAGTTFEVLEKVTTQPDPRYRHSDWYKVRLSNGAIGYFWAGEEFIALGNPGNPNSSSGSGTGSLLSVVDADYFLARPQFYTTGNPFFAYHAPVSVGGTGGLTGNCTWYASGRVKEMGGSPAALASMLGNANNWHNQLSNGATIASSPQVGDIAQWSSNGQNHVAVVEKVNPDGSIVISESNYSLSPLHHVRTIALGAVGTKATGWPDRFIRVPGAGTSTAPSPVNESLSSFEQARQQAVAGAGSAAGSPVGQPWYVNFSTGSGWVQEFQEPSGNKRLLMMQDGSNTAYWVLGDNYKEYMRMGGVSGANPLGFPWNNEAAFQAGEAAGTGRGVWQGFSGSEGKARIHNSWIGSANYVGSVATWGSIGSLYTDMGGASSWLGVPTKPEWHDADGVTIWAEFENGLIAHHKLTGETVALSSGQQPNWQSIQSAPDFSNDFLKIGGFLEDLQGQFQARNNSPQSEFVNDLIDVTAATAGDLFKVIDGVRELHNIVVIESKLKPEDLGVFLKYAQVFIGFVAGGSAVNVATQRIRDEFLQDASISAANKNQATIDAIIKALSLLVDIMGIDSLSLILKYGGLSWGILTDQDPVKKAVKELGFEVGRAIGTKGGRALGTSVSVPLGFPGSLVGASVGHMILGVSTSLSMGYAFVYAQDYMSKYGEQITNQVLGYVSKIWEGLATSIFPVVKSAFDRLMSGEVGVDELVNFVTSIIQRGVTQIFKALADVIADLLFDVLDDLDKLLHYAFKPVTVYAADESWPSGWDTTPLL